MLPAKPTNKDQHMERLCSGQSLLHRTRFSQDSGKANTQSWHAACRQFVSWKQGFLSLYLVSLIGGFLTGFLIPMASKLALSMQLELSVF